MTIYYIKVNLKKERLYSKQARSKIRQGFEFCGIIPKKLRVKLEKAKSKNKYRIRIELNKKLTEEEIKVIIHNSLFYEKTEQITVKTFDDKSTTTSENLVGR